MIIKEITINIPMVVKLTEFDRFKSNATITAQLEAGDTVGDVSQKVKEVARAINITEIYQQMKDANAIAEIGPAEFVKEKLKEISGNKVLLDYMKKVQIQNDGGE